jgi:hypothetical protein
LDYPLQKYVLIDYLLHFQDEGHHLGEELVQMIQMIQTNYVLIDSLHFQDGGRYLGEELVQMIQTYYQDT